MFQEIECTSQFYRIMLIFWKFGSYGLNFAIKFAEKTLKNQKKSQ